MNGEDETCEEREGVRPKSTESQREKFKQNAKV
jgi:hypothetical protein